MVSKLRSTWLLIAATVIFVLVVRSAATAPTPYTSQYFERLFTAAVISMILYAAGFGLRMVDK
jgi:hypothetical protein